MKIAIERILPNPEQPRKEISAESLAELVESITLHGLILPIAVEEAGEHYILIDGERRWRACKAAGLSEIEASVRPSMNGSGQVERLVLALTANIQRRNMDPIEMAESFKKMMELGFRVQEIAETVGMHESSVYNYLAMLSMTEPVKQLYRAGKLSSNSDAAKALIQIKDLELQTQVATLAAERGMSSQEMSRMINRMKLNTGVQRRKAKAVEISTGAPAKVWDRHWNMVAQAGVFVADANLVDAAENTCKACALYAIANKTNCKECPAVTMLRLLVGGAK